MQIASANNDNYIIIAKPEGINKNIPFLLVELKPDKKLALKHCGFDYDECIIKHDTLQPLTKNKLVIVNAYLIELYEDMELHKILNNLYQK